MPMTPQSYDAEMRRIAEKHGSELVYLLNINVFAATLPTAAYGEHIKLMMHECVRCYCVVNGITLDQLRACALDMDAVESGFGDHQPAWLDLMQADAQFKALMERLR